MRFERQRAARLQIIALLTLLLSSVSGIARGAEGDDAEPDDAVNCKLTVEMYRGHVRVTTEVVNTTDHDIHVDSTPDITWVGHGKNEGGKWSGGGGSAGGVEYRVTLKRGEKRRRRIDIDGIEKSDGIYIVAAQFYSKEVRDGIADVEVKNHVMHQKPAKPN